MFDDLSVRDNLTLMRADRRLDAFEPLFARFPILKRRLAQHAGTLSGGEKKMLSFVRGLSRGAAAAAARRAERRRAVGEHRADGRGDRGGEAAGVAFVVVEQNLAFAERIADRYLVIEQGRVVLAGRRAEIGRDQLLGASARLTGYRGPRDLAAKASTQRHLHQDAADRISRIRGSRRRSLVVGGLAAALGCPTRPRGRSARPRRPASRCRRGRRMSASTSRASPTTRPSSRSPT